MKILVLAGGLSPERDVSLSSGSLIANSLMNSGNEVLLADIFLGTETADLPFRKTGDTPYAYQIPPCPPDLEELRQQLPSSNALIGPHILELCHQADTVFLALHGAMGENGQLQAILEAEGIRFTGSGRVGCLLAMDKDLTKKLLRFACIPTADWITTDLRSAPRPQVSFPCVVKPCSCGSSVGVSIVENEEELEQALKEAQKFESFVLIEQKIPGREFSVGILDGKALPVIEIIPKEGFYDYKNKYQANATEEICPAPLTEEQTRRVQELALRVHNSLRLKSYSRIDFILGPEGEFFCLEANTLPGMTPNSLLPQEAYQAGISYDELCMKIVELAQ